MKSRRSPRMSSRRIVRWRACRSAKRPERRSNIRSNLSPKPMAYRTILPEDLLPPADYERRRRESIKEIIALKTRRRLEVGPWVSLAFENRRTVIHQIQEMIRIERIIDPAAVRHEIET